MWQGAPMMSHQEPKRVYKEPAVFTRYRLTKKPGPRVVIDELVSRFKKARDEKEVAVTVRQLAVSCKMSKSSVENAIKVLVADGAIVVESQGTFEGKRKPSCYRLTMYPCRGKPATFDFVEDVNEWRRAGRKRRPSEPQRVTVAFDISIEQRDAIFADYKRANAAGFPDVSNASP
jgi:hypothetical protein